MIKMLKTKLFILIFIGFFVFSKSAVGPRLKNIPLLGQCFRQKTYNPNKIWRRFNATDISGNKMVEYQIRNIPKERFPKAISLMQQFEDEPQNNVRYERLTKKRTTEYKMRCESILRYNMSMACFNNADEMVGVVLLYIGKKMDSKKKRGESSRMGERGFDIFEHYKVDEYLASYGMNVLREYRDRGIAKHFILAFKDICEEHGLNVVASIVLNDAVNKIGNELGYETHKVDSFAEDDVMLTLRSIKFEHK